MHPNERQQRRTHRVAVLEPLDGWNRDAGAHADELEWRAVGHRHVGGVLGDARLVCNKTNTHVKSAPIKSAENCTKTRNLSIFA